MKLFSYILLIGSVCLASCDLSADEVSSSVSDGSPANELFDGGDIIQNDPIIQGPVSTGSGSSQTYISNADVKVKDPTTGQVIASTITDSLGLYVVQVPQGVYDVETSATGYTTELDEDLVVDENVTHPVSLQ